MSNDKELDTWDRKVKIYGNPVYGKRYLCELRGYNSGNIFSVVLDAVDGGDYLWQDALGDEINEMAFDVISWVELASTQEQQKIIEQKDKEIEELRIMDKSYKLNWANDREIIDKKDEEIEQKDKEIEHLESELKKRNELLSEIFNSDRFNDDYFEIDLIIKVEKILEGE